MGAPNDQLARLARSEVFAVGGETFTWGDVVLASLVDGGWPLLEARTWHGLVAVRTFSASGEELSSDEMSAAAKSFRYERDLLAAEELHRWLERWAISPVEWRDFLERELLRRRSTGEPAGHPPHAEVAAVIGVEAICSGSLEQAARRLASEAALARQNWVGEGIGCDAYAEVAAELLGVSVSHCAERLELIGRVGVAAVRARAAITSERAIERELAAHRLDWLRVELDVVEFADEDAAREALLCVRSDGLALATVAEQAGRALRRLAGAVADAPEWLAPHLLGVKQGSLLGPLRNEGGVAVVSVVSTREPSEHDPEMRRRAEALLVERAARRAVAASVEWREPCLS
jgi:hypothetical protein